LARLSSPKRTQILRMSKPLRVPEPPVDTTDFSFMSLGGPRGHCLDYDWKDWRIVGRSLRKIVKERGFKGKLPRSGSGEEFEGWLEALNYLIGCKENFADGWSYQLLDLAPGSDSYTILFCPKGYRIPKWALWDEKKAAARDRDDPKFES
jgi:hypothetical protein